MNKSAVFLFLFCFVLSFYVCVCVESFLNVSVDYVANPGYFRGGDKFRDRACTRGGR